MPRHRPAGWTLDAWIEHRRLIDREHDRFYQERDRRYSEVSSEREKALKIKEQADLAALQLAREIQTYKDEKANELREQISSERGLYATKADLVAASEKIEASLGPLKSFVATSQGGRDVSQQHWGLLIGVVGLLLVGLGILTSSAVALLIHFTSPK